MSHKTAATVAHTIGIDTGKNTLHLVGLDDKGQSFCGKRALATGSQSGSPVCHKNDFRDAHAIAEAVQRPSTRCVPVKTADQLDLQTLHRCDPAWSANEQP